MAGRAPVSVAAGASTELPPVSPPPIDAGNFAPASGGLELAAVPSEAPVHAMPSTTTDTTPSGSPARPTPTSEAQHGEQRSANNCDLPTTPETERSASEGVATPTESEKGANGTQNTANRDQNGATAAVETTQNGGAQVTGQQEQQVRAAAGHTEKKATKKWFDFLPTVLQNFKTQGREQIRQLMLPRCELCKRGKVDKKAEVKCNQDGCILRGDTLCSSCWKSTHSSESGRKHRQLPASVCKQCQLERIAYWCAECDLQFCTYCFDLIHIVPTTKSHRKLATEDAPGTCIAQSHWASNFQNVIFQMIAARKRPPPASTGSSGYSVGEKRKRDVEVIVIDGSDDEEENETVIQVESSLANGISGQQVDDRKPTVNQQNSSITGAGNAETESALSRPSEASSQLPMPQRADSINSLFQPPAAQKSMIELVPLPQEQTEVTSTPLASPEAVQRSSAYSTPTTSSGANTFNINSSVEDLQGNISASQLEASVSMGSSSTAFATSVMSNGMMHVVPSSMPTAVSTTDGVWSTTSAISTDPASTSNPNNLLPLGGAVFAENALVDSLVDRYHELNQNVTKLEMKCEQLTRQIAVATCQGPYVAGPIMALLSKLQPVLEAVRVRRDKLLIAMIIQSSDIMASVRILRLTELGDVPQVPMISHRKCLQITNEINHHKKKLIELNQHLSETLTQSHGGSSSWESTFIRTTSANIQMHEKSIKELKKAREVEFVRIVQFSLKIRDALKAAFQRTVDMQRQHQQQFQQ
ncbi:hypothetical protein JG687_00006580 [Phytophthora cactorum]|uniref:B box-type domain-containing protein n=1 Tax=Phytophthora cactorum TaxID=29920 RepID=A0A329SRT8_9STRA|nr:hypothetical protein Pcac1_g84 [Phytophthora cactorum]KAG2822122.1 hypothetical protein PC111_g10753 [Phytophthora cactorum]KAG2842788.1 hypothetical protein PC112_g2879 [Phytophthora cactorum]KAG2901795.1 hypothetical protein PC114_g13010 [Phytophthora cactorum]KAG2915579.1 hypothetical protein PC115_g11347 [Phytophthora cactorum]